MICDPETYADRVARIVTENMRKSNAEYQDIVARGGYYNTCNERLICRAVESKHIRDLIPADDFTRI